MENTTEHQFPNLNIKGLTRSVLVTGGAGYVGSHTCKVLSKNGYIPITVDRHYNRHGRTMEKRWKTLQNTSFRI